MSRGEPAQAEVPSAGTVAAIGEAGTPLLARLGPSAGRPFGPVVASWLLARIVVVAGWATFGRHPPGARSPVGLWEALSGGDGTFYARIAEHGYERCGANDFSCVEVRRFFPLLGAVGRALGVVTPLSERDALLLAGNAFALLAGVLVWRLLHAVTGDVRVASLGVWMLTLFPSAAVFTFAYGESLAVCLLAAVLLASRRPATASGELVAVGRGMAGGRRTSVAVGAGFASGLLRPTGVLVGIPAMVEAASTWWRSRRGAEPGRAEHGRARRLAVIGLAPLAGVLAYLGYLAARFDAFGQPLTIQRRLRAGFHEPVSRLARAVWETLQGDFGDAYNAAFAVGVVAVLVVGIVRWRRVIPAGWFVLAAVGLAISLSANLIDSAGRYALAYFPAWLAAMALEVRSRPRWRWPVLLLELVGLFVYVSAAMDHSMIA